jgi:predicted GNAT family acetyltransferase
VDLYPKRIRISIENEPAKSRYVGRAGNRLAGHINYRQVGDALALLHTEVDAEFEGEGVGGALVSAVLDDARSRGLEVLPFCPFVNSYLRRHPEQIDLVPESRLREFGLDRAA